MSTNLDVAVISPWKAELVKDIFPASFDLSADSLTNFNNTLYFQVDQTESYRYAYSAKEQLWKSDGTETGTNLVKDQGSSYYTTSFLDINNNSLYFEVYNPDPSTMTSSLQLWKTDGTDTGVQLVKDLGSSLDIKSKSFIPIENNLYFTVGSSVDATQLWKTDGTETGTVLVKDFDNIISNVREINNSLYLDVNEYNPVTSTSTAQLWKTDTTNTGVELIKDFGDFIFDYSYQDNTAIVNNTLYFEIRSPYFADSSSSQLWKSDGTDTGTTLVKDLGSLKNLSEFLGKLNNNFYFSVSVTDSEDPYTTTHELWKSDGTDAGTTLVQDFGDYSFDYLTTVNNTLYFTTNSYDTLTSKSNYQLWEIDGDNGNVSLLKDLGEYSLSQWETIDNNLYFQLSRYDSSTYTSTTQLWKTDGTDIGTTLIQDFPNSSFMSEDELGVINNTLYFPLSDPNYGTELWMTDGTETGTIMVADINPGKRGSSPSIPVDVNGTLYLLADDGIHGNELWKLTPTGSNLIPQDELRNNAKALAMSHLNSMSELISTANPTPTFSNVFETPSNLGLI
ncbi:hypothetical protein [Planktothrix mougeotii]|uniref:Hyalin repeat protein n=1 Tax=Planktothrix mougeotii LEGE 06226 TaxID=1828728 RepID=A0ABR9U7R6_9CYAN|nr:hypothetical protein [Planktothrix mougeotii]MBE9142503.1 hypothetical protein [Planktothrix mougeotii LEGE 06226]